MNASSLALSVSERTAQLAKAARQNQFKSQHRLLKNPGHAILAEDVAVAAFKDAMAKDLPAPIKDIVTRQSTEVKSAHDKIRNLRDSAAQK